MCIRFGNGAKSKRKEPDMGLIVDSGGSKVGPEALADIPCPPPTNSWTPIPHSILRESVLDRVNRLGWTVTGEEWALSKARKFRNGTTGDPECYYGFGRQVFGLLHFNSMTDNEDFVVGIRSSLDKTLAINAVFGTNVLICDNLLLTGEECFYRKHTSLIDLNEETKKALDFVASRLENWSKFTNKMKEIEVSDADANAIIVNAVRFNGLKGTDAKVIADAWLDNKPPTADAKYNGFATRLLNKVYSDRTAWNLHGMFTDTSFKTLNVHNNLVERNGNLNRIFEDRFPELLAA